MNLKESTSPILTRFASGLPVAEIAFFRMLLGSFFFLVAAKVSKMIFPWAGRNLLDSCYMALCPFFIFFLHRVGVLYYCRSFTQFSVYGTNNDNGDDGCFTEKNSRV